MKIITFSTLYPNAQQPRHGIFVETRLKKLIDNGNIESIVVAPVPWFPFKNKCFGLYAEYASVKIIEEKSGITIYHPRYLVIPKLGMLLTPYFLARAARKCIRNIIRAGYDFDVFDAHYFYPDGIAAARLGEYFSKPVVITARGSDINLIGQLDAPRKKIIDAAKSVAALVTVSSALKEKMADLGVDRNKITVLRNGVDLEKFHPSPERQEFRKNLGVSGTVLVSVGNLIEPKGHHLIIEALQKLPDTFLIIIGKGPQEMALKNLVLKLQLKKHVIFIQHVYQNELYKYYSAADILVLASSREGWPNVLLEAMACGTPVVSINVGGVPEIIQKPEAGLFIQERSSDSIVKGIKKLCETMPTRAKTEEYVQQFSWDETTQGQEQLFSRVKINS